jgi:NAD(P)-dependent dehydrogenase (short-subunit alcohol dehydrogenase family)
MGDELLGKVVVITGSTRGIGRAMAESCATAGATVAVSSRDGDAVASTVETLRGKGAIASGIVCDVSKPGDIQALLRRLTTRRFARPPRLHAGT